MDWIIRTMNKLNQNFIFRFLSSVKLAIPLMLILGVVVAWGTVIESQYNSEYSSLLIYKSSWFNILLILLWINIFCATISRIPFKRRHIGFVITHIGLLTLLFGGYLTNRFGIDGQLSIQENQSTRTYVIPELMVGYQYDGQSSIQKTLFPKMLSTKENESLSDINEEIGHVVRVEKYIPFAKAQRMFSSDPTASQDTALSFILKSQFFNVSEWLTTGTNPEMQMGPATLKIVKVNSLEPPLKNSAPIHPQKSRESKKIKHNNNSQTGDKILITNLRHPDESTELRVSELSRQGIDVFGLNIKLKQKYKSAVVAGNKLKENSNGTSDNPAVELLIKKDNQEMREVLYAKFKEFSLNKGGTFGYKFEYLTSTSTEETHDDNENSEMSQSGPQSIRPGSRVIEFRVSPAEQGNTLVVLYKDGQIVQSAKLKEGEKFVTPWMGIEIFVGSIKSNAVESTEIIPMSPEKRKDLPPSAILVSHGADQKFWLTEGDSKNILINNKNVSLYFGKELLELPFDISLKKFNKYDYPGTNTAMSYESLVQIGNSESLQKISMNEPFKKDGFTLYQSSYILNPNEAPVSIFSVNKDPGRTLKYLGSIILSIGIIIFTLMKSRLYKKN